MDYTCSDARGLGAAYRWPVIALGTKSNSEQKKAAKTERFYNVGYVPQGMKPDRPPAINLKGHWLKEAGFDTGTAFTVKITKDCLVLMPNTQELTQLKQQLEQVKWVFNNLI